MSYKRQTFTNGQTLTHNHMNHIEEGLEALSQQVDDVSGNIETALDNIIAIQEALIEGGA